MKTKLAVGSFLVACAILAVRRNAEADPAIIAETAYPSVAWKDFSPTLDLSSPPALRQNESLDLWDPMIFAKDRVVLPLRSAGGRVLWSWEPGKLPIRSEIQGDIQSIAYDDGKDEILILTTNKLLFLRRSSLAILRETLTSIRASDMGVSGRSLIARKRNDFTVYSLPDLQKLRTFSAPQAQFTQNKEPQRAIYLADGTILLNSTYWGAKLLRFHPDRPDIAREESISIPHRALLRFASSGRDDFVSFDPLTSTYAAYRYANGHYYEMTKGMQEFENFSAVRWAPREQNLKIEVVIETDASAKLAELLVLLPPGETYSQTLSGEALVQGSEIIRDRHGNRYAKLFVRLEAGVSRVIVYAATLRRYLFQADLTRFEDQLSRRNYPGFLKNYTGDYKEFEIHNPIVESKKQDILTQAGASNRLFLEKTLSAAAAIPYKGDGRFDPAPVIISQNHGSCTEHTYFTNAILRANDLPGRTVWVWLPVEADIEFNHKIAETWLPGFGWIPMESLSPPREAATTYARFLVFGAFDHGAESLTSGGDTLVKLTENGKRLKTKSLRVQITLDPAEPGKSRKIRNTEEKVE